MRTSVFTEYQELLLRLYNLKRAGEDQSFEASNIESRMSEIMLSYMTEDEMQRAHRQAAYLHGYSEGTDSNWDSFKYAVEHAKEPIWKAWVVGFDTAIQQRECNLNAVENA